MNSNKQFKRTANSVFVMVSAMWFCLFMGICTAPVAAQNNEGVCAKVRLRLSQDVTLTRTVFEATLEITNSRDDVRLENVKVTLDVRNDNQQPANTLFGIKDPKLTGINAVDGTGTITGGATIKAVWTLTPGREAAPEVPSLYFVGGEIAYTQDGTEVKIPLFPAPLLVNPDPLLVLHYFWQRDVYSDDPFTPETEPAEPFSLGLLILNQGNGTARNFRIASSQPQIIENEKGLAIGFKLIGTRLGTEEIPPSFGLNFGDIAPHTTSVAHWLMTASLQGQFVEYKATFAHVDGLGKPQSSDIDFKQPNISLIDSVNIHELEHVVRVDAPADDNKPDFLANDAPDNEKLPDTLYDSDGTVAPVTPLLNASANGSVSETNLTVQITAPFTPGGYIYLRTEDPAREQFRLVRVVRSDGRVLRLDDNV